MPRPIAQRVVHPSLNGPIYEDSEAVQLIIDMCRKHKGTSYPPAGVNEAFSASLGRVRVGPSPIQGRGTFACTGGFKKHEVLGCYEGLVTKSKGPYVMVMFGSMRTPRDLAMSLS